MNYYEELVGRSLTPEERETGVTVKLEMGPGQYENLMAYLHAIRQNLNTRRLQQLIDNSIDCLREIIIVKVSPVRTFAQDVEQAMKDGGT
jgi:hypothetical protein